MEAIKPKNLLEACCLSSGVQGGTIHEYLQAGRLQWISLHGSQVHRMGNVPVWGLLLDSKQIAWTQCYRNELPKIEPSMRMAWDSVYPKPIDAVTRYAPMHKYGKRTQPV